MSTIEFRNRFMKKRRFIDLVSVSAPYGRFPGVVRLVEVWRYPVYRRRMLRRRPGDPDGIRAWHDLRVIGGTTTELIERVIRRTKRWTPYYAR